MSYKKDSSFNSLLVSLYVFDIIIFDLQKILLVFTFANKYLASGEASKAAWNARLSIVCPSGGSGIYLDISEKST